MESESTRAAVEEVLTWVASGCDVLVRGRVASDAAAVLDLLQRWPGTGGVLIRPGGDLPLSALRTHPGAPRRASGPTSVADLASWLRFEVGTTHGLVLVDDPQEVDLDSLRLIASVARRAEARVVAGTGADLLADGGRWCTVLARRAPVEVRVAPLALPDTHLLLERVLGGPVDAEVTADVARWSGGVAQVVELIGRAAWTVGVLAVRDGVRTRVRPWEEVPLGAVAHLLLAEAGADQVATLERVVATDPPPTLAEVEAWAEPGVLDRLDACGLLRPVGPDARLAVDPPALARALVARAGRRRVRPCPAAEAASRPDGAGATPGAPEVAPGVLHRVRDVMSGRLDPAPDVPVGPGPTRRYLDGIEGLRLMYLDRLTEAADTQRGLLDTATAEDDLLGVRVHATVLAEVLLYAGQQDEAWEVATRAVVLPTPAAGADGGLARAFHRRGLRVGAMLAATRGDRGLADALARGVTAAEADEGALDPVAPVAAVLELTEPDDEVAAVGRLWRAGEHLLSRGLVPSALHSWSYAARPYGPGRVRRLRAAFDAAPVPLLERHVRWQEALVHDPDADPAAFGVPAAALHVGHRPADRSTAADAGPSALTVREQEVAALAGRGMSNRAIAHELGLSVRTVENHVSRGLHKLGLHSRSDLIREPVLVPRTPTVAG